MGHPSNVKLFALNVKCPLITTSRNTAFDTTRSKCIFDLLHIDINTY